MSRFEWEFDVQHDDPPKCQRCQGTGEVPAVVAATVGIIEEPMYSTATRTCPDCAGEGVKTTKAKEGK